VVNGTKYILATVTRGGQRWRFKRKTRGEVEELVEDKLVELEKEGVDAVSITGEAKRDAAKARKMVEGETLAEAVRELVECRRLLGLVDADGKPTKGTAADVRDAVKLAVAEYALARGELGKRATLREAVAFWTVRNPDGSAVTLGDARAAFLGELRGDVVRSSAERVAARLVAFAKWLGKGEIGAGDERAVVSIEAREMEEFLEEHKRRSEAGKLGPRRLPFTEATRRKWRVTFRHFFGWATRKYDLPIDPSAKLPRAKKGKVEARSIVFLHAEEVEKLMRAAERIAPAYVPALALLFFAGLRPWELAGKYEGKGEAVPGLDWKSVDRDGQIVVDGATTKTRQRRTVPVEENLRAWLDSYAPKERKGQVARNPIAWRRARDSIVAEAGVEWPTDAARHTYATMHFARYADRARLEANMGHTAGSKLLETNYKSLVTKDEAERFWGIMPEAER